jgi:SAM-dependent methyltransferase
MSRLRLRAAGAGDSDVVARLRQAYDRGAADRDRTDKEPWKLAEREAFLARMRERKCRRLLEIGAGTGQDSAFFQRNGLDVLAVDLSPAMVERCREKGIDARVMDFRQPDLGPTSFDAVYALNCLLHVPNAELPDVLSAVRELLRPGGLFFLGVYGGQADEYARQSFEIVDFHGVDLDGLRFQSLTLSRTAAWTPDVVASC